MYSPAGLEVAAQLRGLAAMRSKSSMSRSTPASRGDGEQVQHGVGRAAAGGDARRSRSRATRVVMRSLGRRPRRRTSMTSRPASSATSPWSASWAGTIERAHRARCPCTSKAIAIVLAVNWPPQAPAPGQASSSSSRELLVGHLAGGVGADGLEDVLDRDVVAVEAAGRRSSRRRASRPGTSRRASAITVPGIVLSQPTSATTRVEQVAAGDELDRVGDDLAADELGLHARSCPS